MQGIGATGRALGAHQDLDLTAPRLLTSIGIPLIADCFAMLQYTCRAEPALACELSVFAATDDPLVPLPTLPEWANHTTGRVRIHQQYTGGHVFLASQGIAVFRQLAADLTAALAYDTV